MKSKTASLTGYVVCRTSPSMGICSAIRVACSLTQRIPVLLSLLFPAYKWSAIALPCSTPWRSSLSALPTTPLFPSLLLCIFLSHFSLARAWLDANNGIHSRMQALTGSLQAARLPAACRLPLAPCCLLPVLAWLPPISCAASWLPGCSSLWPAMHTHRLTVF